MTRLAWKCVTCGMSFEDRPEPEHAHAIVAECWTCRASEPNGHERWMYTFDAEGPRADWHRDAGHNVGPVKQEGSE